MVLVCRSFEFEKHTIRSVIRPQTEHFAYTRTYICNYFFATASCVQNQVNFFYWQYFFEGCFMLIVYYNLLTHDITIIILINVIQESIIVDAKSIIPNSCWLFSSHKLGCVIFISFVLMLGYNFMLECILDSFYETV